MKTLKAVVDVANVDGTTFGSWRAEASTRYAVQAEDVLRFEMKLFSDAWDEIELLYPVLPSKRTAPRDPSTLTPEERVSPDPVHVGDNIDGKLWHYFNHLVFGIRKPRKKYVQKT